MFIKDDNMKPFESKVWLSSPTMHGEELKYMTEAFETNWMSTVGANINEVNAWRRIKSAANMRWHYLLEQLPFIWL